jgi:phosphoglucosamine mutase
VIGKDTRLSGYMIESALVSGFTAVGMDVFQLGPMPTPAVAMLTRSLRADLGVMISASHNSFVDNGIKLFGPDGYKLSDAKEKEIELLMRDNSSELLAAPDKIGRASRIDSAQERYIEFAKRTLPKNTRFDGIRVVIDCANGAAYKVAPQVLWELGAEVIKIGVEPNGLNINKDCGSTAPEDLIRKVKEVRADIGIALDGDADRVVIVDEKGRIIDGDQLMAVIAESWLSRGRLTGGGVVATVMSNLGLERYLEKLGLSLTRTPVGDRSVVEHMRQHSYNVGGGAVRPYRSVRLLNHRRWPSHGLTDPRRGCAKREASERGLQSFPAFASNSAERQIQERPAARQCRRRKSDQRRQDKAWQVGPAHHPPLGHGTRYSSDGRGRRRAAG